VPSLSGKNSPHRLNFRSGLPQGIKLTLILIISLVINLMELPVGLAVKNETASTTNISNNSTNKYASKLFNDLKQQVYQIRVIDLASDDKNSIGSGFLISDTGLIATNFHVVSSYVHEPEKYRLEYIDHQGERGDFSLQNIDVVHDLAIGKIEPTHDKHFSFNFNQLAQGDQLYSIGNPYDLGMTIIDGIYNGLIQKSRYKKFLFSGSLNPGMSGGPAVDESGRVIGINVSKGSEQLSFLVPVEHLEALRLKVIDKGTITQYDEVITHSLLEDQELFYSKLLKKTWKQVPFMEVSLPTELDEALKCWGHTRDKEEDLYKSVHQHCQSSDNIYISGELVTGGFSYGYEWTETEELNRFQFYQHLQGRFQHGGLNNVVNEEDATNFSCHTEFVSLSEHEWKVSSCLRAYKKYEGLYDASLVLTSVDRNHKNLLFWVGAAGLSKTNAQNLIRRFMETIQWKL